MIRKYIEKTATAEAVAARRRTVEVQKKQLRRVLHEDWAIVVFDEETGAVLSDVASGQASLEWKPASLR